MSLDAQLISCTGCDFEATEAFPPTQVVYRLESAEEVKGRHTDGWCYRCDDYRYVENIDPEVVSHDLSSAEQDLADAYMRSTELSKEFFKFSKKWFTGLRYREQRGRLLHEAADLPNDLKRSSERLINLRMLLDIASKRNARPRCLHCRSEKTVRLYFDSDLASDFVHTCGGKLKIGEHARGLRFNFGRNVNCYIFNVEGEFIEVRSEKMERSSFLLIAGKH